MPRHETSQGGGGGGAGYAGDHPLAGDMRMGRSDHGHNYGCAINAAAQAQCTLLVPFVVCRLPTHVSPLARVAARGAVLLGRLLHVILVFSLL